VVIRLTLVALLVVALIVPAAAAGAPTISGTDGDVWNAASPPPTYTITATRGSLVEWRLDGGRWARDRWPLVVRFQQIADGKHVLSAREGRGDGDDVDRKEVRRRFRVDRKPPRIKISDPRPGSVYALGEEVKAQYSCSGAVSCTGSVADRAPLPTDRIGPAAFAVQAADDAGNVATAQVDYLVAARGDVEPDGTTQVIRLAPPSPPPVRLPSMQNARRLSPRAGSRITTLRPGLRWQRRARARLYNVQIFALEGATVRKVLSAFPSTARLRVPKGVLAFGTRYVWRVWPYLPSGYTPASLGVSRFDVERPVRLSAAQLLVTQRIAQAALRRVLSVERWLDEGLTTGDLRDGGLGPDDFSEKVKLTGSGAPIANGLATPRPLPERPASGLAAPARIAVTRAQLLINQRISQAALRRVAALDARLAAGLTGGDLRDGAITWSKLAPGLSVHDAHDDKTPPAPTTTAPPPPFRRGDASVRLTDAQALVNLRIARAALRGAARLQGLARGGLTGEHFRAGSITAAQLSDQLRR
jgi:hypothetical protein